MKNIKVDKPVKWDKPKEDTIPSRKTMKVSLTAQGMARGRKEMPEVVRPRNIFQPYKPLPGVLGDHGGMAMDDSLASALASATTLSYPGSLNPAYGEDYVGFMGYPYLAELNQRPEYRKMSEVIAEEMTRKWIKLVGKGRKSKSKKLKEIASELDRLKAKEVFRRAAELDGAFGRGQIYIDMEADALEKGRPLLLDKRKVGDKPIVRLTAVDPTWTSANVYNSTDPLDPTFYRPEEWLVMGTPVHASRMITVISREVPDLLKPAYNFGGLSITQLAKPYVDNWLRTRQSVSDLLSSFTVFILETNLGGILSGGSGADEYARADMFNQTRDNRGLMMIDKETEAMKNVSAPLSTLDKLQAQTQEHMSAVASTPLVKLLGITPSGLNASSDGEIRAFYDHIHARQDINFAPGLIHLIHLIQIIKYGDIDPDIGFIFEPLWQQDDTGKAKIRKDNADADKIYMDNGALSPLDVREVLADEDEGRYAGVDLSGPAPPLPEEVIAKTTAKVAPKPPPPLPGAGPTIPPGGGARPARDPSPPARGVVRGRPAPSKTVKPAPKKVAARK